MPPRCLLPHWPASPAQRRALRASWLAEEEKEEAGRCLRRDCLDGWGVEARMDKGPNGRRGGTDSRNAWHVRAGTVAWGRAVMAAAWGG